MSDRDIQKLWTDLDRGDEMLHVAVEAGVDRRLVVLAACDCARLALRFVANGEERPRKAIEAAEAWARGETKIEKVDAAAYDAYAYVAATAWKSVV